MSKHIIVTAALGLTALGSTHAHADPVHHFDTASEHGCAANDCSTVFCWGALEEVYGGEGGVTSHVAQTWPYQVGTGLSHSCVTWRGTYAGDAISNQGIIDCWGSNDYGQLDVPEGGWRQLASGADHNCATNWSHNAVCWGRDDEGQVSGVPANQRFATLSAAATQSCGVTRRNATSGRIDGESIRCWGKTAGNVATVSATELSSGELIDKVSAGLSHACVLSELGVVYCWGSNDAGQVTWLDDKGNSSAPLALENGEEMFRTDNPSRVYFDVSAGDMSTCVIYEDIATFDRGIECWGYPFSYGDSLWTVMTTFPNDPHAPDPLPATEVPLEAFYPLTVDVSYNEVCALGYAYDDKGNVSDDEVRCWAALQQAPTSCDPLTDPRCCAEASWECCDPSFVPGCCDPAVDPSCRDKRPWEIPLVVEPNVCL